MESLIPTSTKASRKSAPASMLLPQDTNEGGASGGGYDGGDGDDHREVVHGSKRRRTHEVLRTGGGDGADEYEQHGYPHAYHDEGGDFQDHDDHRGDSGEEVGDNGNDYVGDDGHQEDRREGDAGVLPNDGSGDSTAKSSSSSSSSVAGASPSETAEAERQIEEDRAGSFRHAASELERILGDMKQGTKRLLGEVDVYLRTTAEVSVDYVRCQSHQDAEARRLEEVEPDVAGATERFLQQAAAAMAAATAAGASVPAIGQQMFVDGGGGNRS